MNYIKSVLNTAIFAFVFLIIGCSSHTKIDRLSSDIQSLNTKVDQVHNDVNIMRSDIQSVKDDAVRANQRLDNQATKYRK